MKRILFAALIPTFIFTNPMNPAMQTLTISPELMPKVLAFMQKQGRLPTPQELRDGTITNQPQLPQTPVDPEQAKFCNVVGSCATGFVATIVTGNPAHVFSALASTILPMISRSKDVASEPTITLLVLQDAGANR